MADRNRQDDDWAREVPQRRFRGPYRDYGWEQGDSVLPEFRDPDVHEMPWDEQRRGNPRRRPGPGNEFEEAYDWQTGRNLFPEQRGARQDTGRAYGTHTGGDYYSPEWRGYESGYGVERYRRTQDWNVSGPHTGRGPRGYQRSNERIQEDVADRFTQAGYLDASDIEINVQNGEVTLTGSVDSRQAKRLAEDIAESVTGVRDVHNQLRIQGQQGQQQNTGLNPAGGSSNG